MDRLINIRTPKIALSVLLATMILFLQLTSCTSETYGIATVIDGDTLRMNSTSIRLWGIDAPEKKQKCIKNDQTWACGKAASKALQAHINNQSVTCKSNTSDNYGRTIAVCFTENSQQSLNAWLVNNGWAVDSIKYSFGEYQQQQEYAKKHKLGIWASDFQLPWKWRQRHQ